jgi:hypothetical protein
MQLKLRRSQRDGGLVAKNVIFCLDARAELTHFERDNLSRYKLYDQVIYNSEAAKRQLDKSVAATSEGTATGLLRGVVHLALTALRLNITIRSLERGHHIECKSMDELLAAEEAIMEACRNLKVYLDVAATFDGSEVVVEFATGEPVAVAASGSPEPILAPTFLPSGPPSTAAPVPQLVPAPAYRETCEEAQTAYGESEPEWQESGETAAALTGLDDPAVKVALVTVIVLLVLFFGAQIFG